MPVLQVEASSEELLRAVAQLPPEELASFVERVVVLRAERAAPHLNWDESGLLLTINRAIPLDLQQRYDELITKRRSETLTPDEYTELLTLTNQMEQFEVGRVRALAELAQLRQTSLTDLMYALGIEAPAYV